MRRLFEIFAVWINEMKITPERKIRIGVLILVVLALLFITINPSSQNYIRSLFHKNFASPNLSSDSSKVILPNVVGKKIGKAQSILMKRGLIPMTGERPMIYKEYSNEFNQDIVLYQHPFSNGLVYKHTKVTLFIHRGGALKVPNVVSMSSKRAGEILKENGLSCEIIMENSNNHPQGTVIRQIPGPETPIETVTLIQTVTLVVSK